VARKKRRNDGEGVKTVLGVILMTVAVVVLGAGGYLYYSASTEPEIDETTLCPLDGPVGHLAILLDTTDPLTLTHLQAARQIVSEKIDRAAVGTRIGFSTVNPDSEIRRSAFFSICKPPSGEEASMLTQNPRIIEENFRRKFVEPVEMELDRLLDIPQSPSSPIMESIQEFASSIPGYITAKVPRELVIVSDLMQHSAAFSFYRNGTWASFKAANGPERFGLAFDGASVTILRIPRNVQKTEVVDDFWVRYFDAQGFDRVRVRTIGDL